MSTSLSGPVLYAAKHLPVICVERRQPAAHAELAAAVSHKHFVLHHRGAIVTVSPRLISPSLVFQSCLPVSASRAMV